jgi:hypothetical protein
VLSLIAFRGENRSDPIYIRSAEPTETQGQGIVVEQSLILNFGKWGYAPPHTAFPGGSGRVIFFFFNCATYGRR